MKFAPVVSHEYNPADITNYHLILAHEIVQDPGAARYYQSLKDHTVILDNSVVELGEAVGLDYFEKAWNLIPDSYIVVPDAIGDSNLTIELARRFSRRYRELDKAMIVPQGVSVTEWTYCLEYLVGLIAPHCNSLVVGIPRVSEDLHGGRGVLYGTAMLYNIWRGPFHLLGIQHNLRELNWAKSEKNIWGVDSSMPLRAANSGISSLSVQNLREVEDVTTYVSELYHSVRYEITSIQNYVSNRSHLPKG